MTHALCSWARWPIAFQRRILCKYCVYLKSGAVLALYILTKTFILPTYFVFSKIHTHFKCAMTAILMTSLLGPDAELRWANWLKLLQIPQSLILYRSPKNRHEIYTGPFFGPFHLDYKGSLRTFNCLLKDIKGS